LRVGTDLIAPETAQEAAMDRADDKQQAAAFAVAFPSAVAVRLHFDRNVGAVGAVGAVAAVAAVAA
jgi:hypothetical protein